jgi:hypothetical protein
MEKRENNDKKKAHQKGTLGGSGGDSKFGERDNLKHEQRQQLRQGDLIGSVGISKVSPRFIPNSSFNDFEKFLQESMTWTKPLLFNQADIDKDPDGMDMVDLCAKHKLTTYKTPYIFPQRFTGSDSKQKLLIALKLASMQTGFILGTRSSQKEESSADGKSKDIYQSHIRLTCQHSNAYCQSKSSRNKYGATTKLSLSEEKKCCYTMKIALIRKISSDEEINHNFNRKTSVEKQFYQSNIGRWILIPETKGACSMINIAYDFCNSLCPAVYIVCSARIIWVGNGTQIVVPNLIGVRNHSQNLLFATTNILVRHLLIHHFIFLFCNRNYNRGSTN